MRKIYKFPFSLQVRTLIGGSIIKPLCVQEQHGQLCLWAEVDTNPEALPGDVVLTIVGTGHPIPADAGEYLSTVQQGAYVWHFYWRYLR